MKHPGLIAAAVVVVVAVAAFAYYMGLLPSLPGDEPSFAVNLTADVTNRTVNYTAVASGGVTPYSYIWDFGDGGSRISDSGVVVYTYTAPGTYTTSVIVRDSSDRFVEASITVTVV